MRVASDQDTIAAISTALGEAAIGIVRMSGENAVTVAEELFRDRKGRRGTLSAAVGHTLHYGTVVDPRTGVVVDEVLVGVMRKPRTYTREDVVEFNCHGGIVAVREVLRLCLETGKVRAALAGEFTKRAFLNGRLDLAQAEAVIDVIRAQTGASLRGAMGQLGGKVSEKVESLRAELVGMMAELEASLDFPEDVDPPDREEMFQTLIKARNVASRLAESAASGRIYREGVTTAIVGKPNVGKSSLLNQLLEEERAIVTDIPGTTRDIIEETVSVRGIPLRLLDTAGIRRADDPVERRGVERARAAAESADLLIVVVDGSEELTEEDRGVLELAEGRPAVAVINKSDRPQRLEPLDVGRYLDGGGGRSSEAAGEVRGGENRPATAPVVRVSALTGDGVEELRDAVAEVVFGGRVPAPDQLLIGSQRHQAALYRAGEALAGAAETLKQGMPEDLAGVEIREAIEELGLITGQTADAEVVDEIFRRFCIGK